MGGREAVRARRQPTLPKKIVYIWIAGDFTKGKSSKARAGMFLQQAELWGQSAGHKALRFVKDSIWASINNNDQVNLFASEIPLPSHQQLLLVVEMANSTPA